MSELYEKSLTKLELDRVLDLLADHAGSPDAAARCVFLLSEEEANRYLPDAQARVAHDVKSGEPASWPPMLHIERPDFVIPKGPSPK